MLVLVLVLVSIHRNFNCVLEAERDMVARVSLSPSFGDHHTWYSPLLSGGGRIICLIPYLKVKVEMCPDIIAWSEHNTVIGRYFTA